MKGLDAACDVYLSEINGDFSSKDIALPVGHPHQVRAAPTADILLIESRIGRTTPIHLVTFDSLAVAKLMAPSMMSLSYSDFDPSGADFLLHHRDRIWVDRYQVTDLRSSDSPDVISRIEESPIKSPNGILDWSQILDGRGFQAIAVNGELAALAISRSQRSGVRISFRNGSGVIEESHIPTSGIVRAMAFRNQNEVIILVENTSSSTSGIYPFAVPLSGTLIAYPAQKGPFLSNTVIPLPNTFVGISEDRRGGSYQFSQWSHAHPNQKPVEGDIGKFNDLKVEVWKPGESVAILSAQIKMSISEAEFSDVPAHVLNPEAINDFKILREMMGTENRSLPMTTFLLKFFIVEDEAEPAVREIYFPEPVLFGASTVRTEDNRFFVASWSSRVDGQINLYEIHDNQALHVAAIDTGLNFVDAGSINDRPQIRMHIRLASDLQTILVYPIAHIDPTQVITNDPSDIINRAWQFVFLKPIAQ